MHRACRFLLIDAGRLICCWLQLVVFHAVAILDCCQPFPFPCLDSHLPPPPSPPLGYGSVCGDPTKTQKAWPKSFLRRRSCQPCVCVCVCVCVVSRTWALVGFLPVLIKQFMGVPSSLGEGRAGERPVAPACQTPAITPTATRSCGRGAMDASTCVALGNQGRHSPAAVLPSETKGSGIRVAGYKPKRFWDQEQTLKRYWGEDSNTFGSRSAHRNFWLEFMQHPNDGYIYIYIYIGMGNRANAIWARRLFHANATCSG